MQDVERSRPQASLTTMLTEEPSRLRQRSISLGVHPGEADDVAQAIALKAWRAVNGVRSTDYRPMCVWLDTIARNAAADYMRVRSRNREVELDDDLVDASDIEVEAELTERFGKVVTAISALPESLRVPLLMSAVDGLSADSIAAELGITSANARQRISRARRALLNL